jgi:hypothetical protein
MTPLRKGTYWTSIAVSPAELEVAQCLRAKAFNTGPKGAQIEPVDRTAMIVSMVCGLMA